MRTLLVLLAAPLITTFAPVSLYRAPPIPEQPRLWAQPVPLDPERPARRRVGRLTYLGGWVLTSNDPRFGGISAMAVEGSDVLAVSDAGTLFGFSVPKGKQVQALSVRQLLEGPGNPTRKMDRDTEAMAVAGPHLWASFERNNVVWRYDRETLKTSAASAPAPMQRWSENSGSEAMVRLADGRFLIFSERVRNGNSEALLFDGDPAVAATKVRRLLYRPPSGYRITDAAVLPDGGLIFLNRRWGYLNGFSAKLTLLAKPDLEGSTLTGEEVASIELPLTTDNFEALAVTREAGRTILWIASDDNFLALQRTLLLKFALS